MEEKERKKERRKERKKERKKEKRKERGCCFALIVVEVEGTPQKIERDRSLSSFENFILLIKKQRRSITPYVSRSS